MVSKVLDKKGFSKVNRLQRSFEAITTQNSLLKAKNERFRTALHQKVNKRKRNKPLFEQLRAKDGYKA